MKNIVELHYGKFRIQCFWTGSRGYKFKYLHLCHFYFGHSCFHKICLGSPQLYKSAIFSCWSISLKYTVKIWIIMLINTICIAHLLSFLKDLSTTLAIKVQHFYFVLSILFHCLFWYSKIGNSSFPILEILIIMFTDLSSNNLRYTEAEVLLFLTMFKVIKRETFHNISTVHLHMLHEKMPFFL